ncbi:uncharacterized protein LOC116337106 [Contarinia nasturtii]|uniref:uncharacterized protein LOC116337106 n=1 Tax=Contarinia nasturtii TaxID=265458 RepID=UPI0012D3E4E6|nr:uncharacterized protein LOC116337106 [Contarinia nasturtii]
MFTPFFIGIVISQFLIVNIVAPPTKPNSSKYVQRLPQHRRIYFERDFSQLPDYDSIELKRNIRVHSDSKLKPNVEKEEQKVQNDSKLKMEVGTQDEKVGTSPQLDTSPRSSPESSIPYTPISIPKVDSPRSIASPKGDIPKPQSPKPNSPKVVQKQKSISKGESSKTESSKPDSSATQDNQKPVLYWRPNFRSKSINNWKPT